MIDKIKEYDKSFKEKKFKELVKDTFFKIHQAVTTKELLTIKPMVTKEVFDLIIDKISDLASRHLIQEYDINIKDIILEKLDINENEIILKVNITSRYMSYLTDENGNYKSGNNKFKVDKLNRLSFTKKLNNNWILSKIEL